MLIAPLTEEQYRGEKMALARTVAAKMLEFLEAAIQAMKRADP